MKRVLMIDDEKSPDWFFRPGTEVKFTNEEVTLAKTYDEGMKLLKEQKWDLLLLDHDLGSIKGEDNGYKIICYLEENPDRCPPNVALITFNLSAGAKMVQALEKMEERGVTHYAGWDRG